ncbi:hypothetical protein AAG570_005256 [Ranatra chinensis]|uniref:Gamma-secretase subunit PEN-2 n=1 Tax=Ranatra chinensis TaxID=642074 RepID=A0ABD0XZX3_9HEMI
MDLTKMKDDDKLYLCRWYFKAGFVCLPFVWLVNAVWFFNEAFRRPYFEQQKLMKKYVLFSAIGFLLWVVVIGVWVYIFQTRRIAWGHTGDLLSFVIPTGVQ